MRNPDRGSHLPDNSRRLGQSGFNLASQIIMYAFPLPVRHLAREARTPPRELRCKALISLAGPAWPGRPDFCRDRPSGIKAGHVGPRRLRQARQNSGEACGTNEQRRPGEAPAKGGQTLRAAQPVRAPPQEAQRGCRGALRRGSGARQPPRAGEAALSSAWRVSTARQAPGPRGPGRALRCAAPGGLQPLRPAPRQPGGEASRPAPERGGGRREGRPRIPRGQPGTSHFVLPGVQPPGPRAAPASGAGLRPGAEQGTLTGGRAGHGGTLESPRLT